MQIHRKRWLNRRFMVIACGIFLILIGLLYRGQQLFQFAVHTYQKAVFWVDATTGATRLAGIPAEITDKSTYDALTFDPKRKEHAIISYHLSKPAWVRIRIVRRDQKDLVLKTLVDWSPRDEGENSERWDGRDASGNVVDNTKCFVVFEADTEEHRKHDWGKCHDLQVKLELADRTGLSCKFTGSVQKQTVGYGDLAGYDVRWYIDHSLAHQESYPKGFLGPFDFQWDINKCGVGVHWINLLVDDRHDHAGSASIKVFISSDGSLQAFGKSLSKRGMGDFPHRELSDVE